MSADISSLARITARVRDLDVTDVDDALQYFEKTRQSAMNGDIGIRSGIAAFDLCLPMGIG